MDITIENIMLIGSILLFISILAGKTSYRFGVPTLLLFLAVGMLAGSEGIGGIYFDEPKIAQFIGIVALNFILFSGGLDTRWKSIQPVLWQGISLSTLGVLITALCIGTFAWQITDFTLMEGLLLGAIISSTDAAAVFSILRSKNLALKSNLRPTLELESGSNDPMAYFLTIAFLSLVMNPEDSVWSIIPIFFLQIIIGGIAGFVFGYLSKLVINRIKLGFEGLYPVLVISLMFITFSATDAMGGNGFLAVYLCGVFLGNQNLIHKNTVIKMFDGLAWLMQIILFLTLGLLVFPSQVVPVVGIGLAIAAVLIFVARPIAVFLSLSFFKMKFRRRLYISWVGLRGAVPIVFATYPLIAGIEKANLIFNIVFFVSLTSVLVQGTSLAAVAHWFKVSLPSSEKKLSPVDKILMDESKSHLQEIDIPQQSIAIGKRIVDLKIPAGAIIAMITRNNNFITPKGDTVVEENDILLILTEDRSNFLEIKKYLE
ncbi:potassium/proton antiporter [Christiangramia forsetii]|uniref:Sodium/hydrogen exchanger family protein n=2 Tax=Christiangramia forsetii TaxID=411153 RepID=A0LZJ6_CHRFK|nr:potassium/proton antiporter [Christiangramia forsetii]GGG38465.1 K+/H+ antiporter [Christiangramia forsetii]CAL65791.1 sodium/hydrogen exchanger family protein [Christiangramia forsetii KT0803]